MKERSDSVLVEAEEIVNGPRQHDYGHPLDNFAHTAALWSPILGIVVTPEQVALCMVQLKVSRECHRPKRDNLVDMAGYVATLQKVLDERNRREQLKHVKVQDEDEDMVSHTGSLSAPLFIGDTVIGGATHLPTD